MKINALINKIKKDILFSDNVKAKLEILTKISEFEERKMHFFEKTHAVQKFIVK